MNNIGKGKAGERLASNYLKKRGYRVLEENYKVSFGEIDIIAEKSNYICFIEVKCRKSNRYGIPEEALTTYKRNKIIKVAQFYIKKKNIKNKYFRFDVISILLDNNSLKEIKHITNAFIQ
jgi:putative endonuclease